MINNKNIEQWFALMPEQVRDAALELLTRVQELRADEEIYPAQEDILNALAFVAPCDVRVVILGQDPYHEPGQAMGLAFSVPPGCKLPPSLRNIYKEMAEDLGCEMPESGDLTAWARQGVLLLNTTLTVRAHTANSHAKLGWQALTRAIIEVCMGLPQAIVFMGWGRPALKVIEDARAQGAGTGAAANKFCLRSTHPSPLSANRASGDLPAFMGSHPFSRANALLRESGTSQIEWA